MSGYLAHRRKAFVSAGGFTENGTLGDGGTVS